MSGLLDGSFVEAVNILHHTLDNRGKIVVVGVGKSGNIGHKIAATLNSTGGTAVVLDSQNALHGDLGLLSDGDAVLALSYSGETRELLDLMPFIKRFDVKVIALTGKPGSTLSRLSEVTMGVIMTARMIPAVMKLRPLSPEKSQLSTGMPSTASLIDS